MNVDWSTVFSAFGVLGGLGGVTAIIMLLPRIRKLKADTNKVDVDAALAIDSADDARLKAVVELQTTHLLEPMQREVGRLSKRVEDLESQLIQTNLKYHSAIRWIRLCLAYLRAWNPDPTPQLPAIPADIQPDI